jgi:hypothetical protein
MVHENVKPSLKDGDIQVFTTLAQLMQERGEEVTNPKTILDVMKKHNLEVEQMREIVGRLKDAGFFPQKQ